MEQPSNLLSFAVQDTLLDSRKSLGDVPICPSLIEKSRFTVWLSKFTNYLYGIHPDMHKFMHSQLSLPEDPRNAPDFDKKKKKTNTINKYLLKLKKWKEMDTLSFRIMNRALTGNHDEILTRSKGSGLEAFQLLLKKFGFSGSEDEKEKTVSELMSELNTVSMKSDGHLHQAFYNFITSIDSVSNAILTINGSEEMKQILNSLKLSKLVNNISEELAPFTQQLLATKSVKSYDEMVEAINTVLRLPIETVNKTFKRKTTTSYPLITAGTSSDTAPNSLAPTSATTSDGSANPPTSTSEGGDQQANMAKHNNNNGGGKYHNKKKWKNNNNRYNNGNNRNYRQNAYYSNNNNRSNNYRKFNRNNSNFNNRNQNRNFNKPFRNYNNNNRPYRNNFNKHWNRNGSGQQQQFQGCRVCQATDHDANNCPRLATPPGWNTNFCIPANFMANMALSYQQIGLFQALSAQVNSPLFIVDSGASVSYCNIAWLLSNFNSRVPQIQIQTASGHFIRSLGLGYIGNVSMYFTPQFPANLLSPGQLSELGYEVTMTATEVIIKPQETLGISDSEKVVIKGFKQGSLYFVTADQIKSLRNYKNNDGFTAAYATCLYNKSTQPKNNFWTWHSRTHQSASHLKKLQLLGLVNGIPPTVDEDSQDSTVCPHCILGKIKRRSYKKSSIKINNEEKLTYITTDLKGPIQPMGFHGEKYVISFICRITKFKWVYFLKSKDEGASAFKLFHDKVLNTVVKSNTVMKKKKNGKETEYAPRIYFKVLFSDGGSEFNAEFEKLCAQYGFIHETTPAYTPELNGITENYWRTLFGLTRTIIQQSQIPLNLWPYAVKHANYLLNRLLIVPNSEGILKTPYEWLYGQVPDLSKLRTFGSQVFAHIPKQLRSNNSLGSRARIGKFIGYSDDKIQHAVYILATDVKNVEIMIAEQDNVIYNEVIEPVFNINTGESINSTLDVLNMNQNNISVQPTVSQSINSDNQEINQEPSSEDNIPEESDQLPNRTENSTQHSSKRILQPKRRISERLRSRELKRKIIRQFAHLARRRKSNSVKDDDTITVSEALSSEDSLKWKEAIKSELESIQANDVWTLVDKPPGKHILRTKWILKYKRNHKGSIIKYKARLVILGNMAIKGEDFSETYAPVCKMPSLRLFFSIAVQQRMFLCQLDVNTAFQLAELEEDIYIDVPELAYLIFGNSIDINNLDSYAFKLNKALYGLPQAPRQWYYTIHKYLISQGFTSLCHEPCIYQKIVGNKVILMILYVDDMVFGSTCEEELNKMVSAISQKYKIKILGKPKQLLGITLNISRERSIITMDTKQKILDVIKILKLQQANSVDTPMDHTLKLQSKIQKHPQCRYKEELSDEMKALYRSIVGKLMFIMISTRPDIAFSVSTLARFLANPMASHLQAAKRVVIYLKSTIHMGIKFQQVSNGSYTLIGYSDSDWGSNLDNRRSHSGGILFLGGSPILWFSNQQTTVALSTAEAEINALKEVVKNILWVRAILMEITITQNVVKHQPTVIFEDNAAAIEIVKNPEVNKRNKHMDMAYHFIYENMQEFKNIKVLKVVTDENRADLFTKALIRDLFWQHASHIIFPIISSEDDEE